MDRRRPPSLSASTPADDSPRFGRRAADRGFAAGAGGTWFGRRAGDRKAKIRHSLPFAAQVAAQIAAQQPEAEPVAPYAGAQTIRSGLVKDIKA